jgi:hypothetical protein
MTGYTFCYSKYTQHKTNTIPLNSIYYIQTHLFFFISLLVLKTLQFIEQNDGFIKKNGLMSMPISSLTKNIIHLI